MRARLQAELLSERSRGAQLQAELDSVRALASSAQEEASTAREEMYTITEQLDKVRAASPTVCCSFWGRKAVDMWCA